MGSRSKRSTREAANFKKNIVSSSWSVRVCYQCHEDEKPLQEVDEVVEDEELPDGLLVEEPRQQETGELGEPVKSRDRTHDRHLIMKSSALQFGKSYDR